MFLFIEAEKAGVLDLDIDHVSYRFELESKLFRELADVGLLIFPRFSGEH